MSPTRTELLRSALPRITVDLLFINLALIAAIAGRMVILYFDDPHTLREILHRGIAIYGHNIGPIAGLTLATFLLSGVYTRQRFYIGRYKLLAIVQGSGVSALLYMTLAYLVSLPLQLPRSVTVATFALILVLCGGVRYLKWILAERFTERPRATDPGKSRPRKLLVIGGAGHLGSELCRQLLDEGYTVRVLDILMFGDDAVAGLYKHPEFELIQGDFRHIETVVKAVSGIDAVIHLGAIVGDPACAVDEDHSVEVNYAATRMIREVCRGFGIRRFIFASTCSVYGASDQIVDERSALNPVSLYALTKVESERALLDKHDLDFSPTILRLATVFGISPRPRFDLVVNLVTAMAVVESKCAIFGGDQWRPFIHVHDVARAMLRVLQAPEHVVAGQTYNVGDDRNNMQLREVGDLIEKLIPTAEVVRQEKDVDRRNYRVSFQKIREQLGFTCERDVASGIKELRDAMVEGRITEFRHERYSNLNYLKRLRETGHPSARRQDSGAEIIPLRPRRVSEPSPP
jgi:nucleoside-diphosphate-sugar epimerase